MKMTTLKSVAIAVGFASSAFGQATSPVVGYETISLASGFNYVGLRLHNKPLDSGIITAVDSTSLTSATDIGALLSVGSTYIVEIENTTGVIEEIVSADVAAGVITTSSDLSAVVSVGDSYSIREAANLESVFGDATAAATAFTSASSAGASDQIWIPNAAKPSGFDKYFVRSFGSSRNWRDADTNTNIVATEVPIVYTKGFIFVALNATSLVVSGDLKSTSTELALRGAFNYVSSLAPVGGTLEEVFGTATDAALQLTSASSAGASDQIWIPNAAKPSGFDKYFVRSFGSSRNWRDADTNTNIDAKTISLDDVSGILVVNVGADQNVATILPTEYSGL